MKCLIKAVLLLSAFLMLSACSKGNDKAVNIDPRTGKHPAEWAVSGNGGTHPGAYIGGPSACYECHGKDMLGGISNVSCFSASRSGINCHPGGPGTHPAGWRLATAHGAHAKAALAGADGFAHCQICHGGDFSGGTVNRSCLNTAGCHGAGVNSPHPAKPWLSRLTGASTHSSTDVTNGPACAACHANGANSARKPSTPAAAGTPAGCFNNTLCHANEGHAAGWQLPANHGTAAKAAAGGDKGFQACSVCHGSDFSGGTALQSCLNTAGCHGAAVKAPHPATPWRSTSGGLTHTSTDTSNSPQCAACHTGGNNSSRKPKTGDPVGISGCFNNTLCHGTVGHAAGWSAANVHGAEAKKAPSGSTGFSSCQSCHGSTFNNGTASSCMNNSSCHGSGVNAPHAKKPWSSAIAGQPTHTDTDQGNVGICAACHTAGANSEFGVRANAAQGAAGCFNNTLCHFHQQPYAPSATIPIALHGSEAKKDLSVCQTCHGVKGTTAFDGLTLTDGSKTTACSSCHTAAKAHPTDWQGSGTYSHRSAGNSNVACIICHKVTQAGAGPLAGAPSCFSGTFSNANGQTRTCHANGPGVAPHSVPYSNHGSAASGNSTYCLGCHQLAANAVGSKPPGCQNCHITSPVATPTGCTSCHAAPPSGSSYPNIAAAHAAHAAAGKVSAITNVCSDCHSGLGLATADHQLRAKARTATGRANPVVFGSAALIVAGGGTAPSYSDASGQCANVYCHGAKMPGGDSTGSNKTPAWSVPFLPATLTAAACGTCHGFPPSPASGHPAVTIPAGFPASASIGTTCSCHANISTAGNSYANIFVNKSLHINGTVEVSGGIGHGGAPYPGASHRSQATAGCFGCHPANLAGSTYPASSGTPPNCRSCHLAADPSTDPHCSDCHGDAATGRPSLASAAASDFPKRQGQHRNGADKHSNFACTVCHPFTSGDARHGWSNRIKSTSAQVKTTIGWDSAAKTCNNSCHGTESWY